VLDVMAAVRGMALAGDFAGIDIDGDDLGRLRT
jgi:hypothetical protein